MAQGDDIQYKGAEPTIISIHSDALVRTMRVTCSSTSVYVVYYDNGKNNAVLHRLCSCFQLGPRAAVTQHRALLRYTSTLNHDGVNVSLCEPTGFTGLKTWFKNTTIIAKPREGMMGWTVKPRGPLAGLA